MSGEWFRGESTQWSPPKAGANIHDFGDGLYFADTRAVAATYASTRCSKDGGDAQVFSAVFRSGELGRVLDLYGNQPVGKNRTPIREAWNTYLATPLIPGRPELAPIVRIKAQNEAYHTFFQEFLRTHGLKLSDYDAVIGPEFVRGGKQLAILARGESSSIAKLARARMSLIGPGAIVNSTSSPQIKASVVRRRFSGLRRDATPVDMTASNSRMVGALRSKAAVEMLGQLLGSAIQALGDWGIQRQIEEKLSGDHAENIATWTEQGLGVLVIIRIQEWEREDFNGQRARMLLGISLQPSQSEAEALRQWHGQPRLMQGPARGWRAFERYAWIDPSQ